MQATNSRITSYNVCYTKLLRLGHGVGMEIHEFPNATPSSEVILQENMVITIEPGIYIPTEFGVRIEDLIVIKEDNCENITKSVKKLISL